MRKSIPLLFSILTILVTAQAFAGKEGGGGGGVISGANVYVVDLVESGDEQNPYFDSLVQAKPEFTRRITQALAGLPNVPAALISRKLNEIYTKYDHAFPLAVLKAIELFSWETVDFSLLRINDENQVVDIPASRQVQLAARRQGSVKIDGHYWQLLSAAHRAALVLHEVIYALSEQDDSDFARNLVGYLFNANFARKGLSGFKDRIDNLPFAGLDTVVNDCTAAINHDICDDGATIMTMHRYGFNGTLGLSDGDEAVGSFPNLTVLDLLRHTTTVAHEVCTDGFEDLAQYKSSTNNSPRYYLGHAFDSEQWTLSFDNDGKSIATDKTDAADDSPPQNRGFFQLSSGPGGEADCERTVLSDLTDFAHKFHLVMHP